MVKALLQSCLNNVFGGCVIKGVFVSGEIGCGSRCAAAAENREARLYSEVP